jgi:PTH1 family peptidyl-tRNA hydrolase
MTYMNRSGRAVVELCQLYSLQPEQLLIIYDDLDLAPGRIRLRLGGGSGGHRGVESIIDLLGSTGFARLRIGIGRPPEGIDPVDYVLQRPAPEERALYEAAVKLAAEAALAVVSEGLAAAMNRYNRPLPT